MKKIHAVAIMTLVVIAAMAMWPAVALAGGLVEMVDDSAPVVLGILGVLLGCPVLLLAGKLWGKTKLLNSVVTSIQKARLSMSGDSGGARAAVDRAIKQAMPRATWQGVSAIKKKLGLQKTRK